MRSVFKLECKIRQSVEIDCAIVISCCLISRLISLYQNNLTLLFYIYEDLKKRRELANSISELQTEDPLSPKRQGGCC